MRFYSCTPLGWRTSFQNLRPVERSTGYTTTEDAAMENYHIVSTEAGWELRKEGAARALTKAGTKDELLKITGTFMEGKTASVKIHKKDGVIQEERTYPRAADPRETKG